ncbi:hypothetical protein [Microbacterium sp. A84]|uniref:hypothetical protein n=1 Tax=Microbacterium sp. A84 TaxID=3450715 RepID=UPI003F429052
MTVTLSPAGTDVLDKFNVGGTGAGAGVSAGSGAVLQEQEAQTALEPQTGPTSRSAWAPAPP